MIRSSENVMNLHSTKLNFSITQKLYFHISCISIKFSRNSPDVQFFE